MSPKKLRLLLWGLVAVNLSALGYVGVYKRFVEPRWNAGVEALIGQGEYTLTTTTGADFTEASLTDRASMVFFGFTHCPDVCPTTLGDILMWQEEYPASKDMNVFFVTVDPERDTTEILGDYVGWVDGIEGVTGSKEEVDKALQAFRIYAARVPLEDGDYTMDHSASVLLFDKRGRYTDRIRYQEDPASAVAKIKSALGA